MEFREVIDRRRTTRQFLDKPVVVDKIRRIIEAGIKAPSFDHMRKWNFIVLNDTAAKSRYRWAAVNRLHGNLVRDLKHFLSGYRRG